MAVRAASWAFLGLLFAGAASAAERPAAAGRPTHIRSRPTRGSAATRRRPASSWTSAARSTCAPLRWPTLIGSSSTFPQVTFQLPPKAGESGRGLIKAFRFGLVMQGGSRMVFDLVKPVRIDKAFVIDAADGAPARLVLDLVADRSRELFAQDRARQQACCARRSRRRERAAEPMSATRVRSWCSIPATAASTPAPRRPSGELEKDIVLDFAQRLRDRIEKAGKYRVLMTRSDDTYIPLAERVRMARSAGASLFVSIHADSLPHGEGDAQGATHLHAVGYRLGFGGGAACRGGEQGRRHRRRRSQIRAGRRRRHPDRSRPARDQDFFGPIRAQTGRRNEGCDAIAQESAEIGGVPGVAGAGRAFGAGRTWLRVESAGPSIAAVRHLARPHGGFDRAADRWLLLDPCGRRPGRRELRLE